MGDGAPRGEIVGDAGDVRRTLSQGAISPSERAVEENRSDDPYDKREPKQPHPKYIEAVAYGANGAIYCVNLARPYSGKLDDLIDPLPGYIPPSLATYNHPQ